MNVKNTKTLHSTDFYSISANSFTSTLAQMAKHNGNIFSLLNENTTVKLNKTLNILKHIKITTHLITEIMVGQWNEKVILTDSEKCFL